MWSINLLRWKWIDMDHFSNMNYRKVFRFWRVLMLHICVTMGVLERFCDDLLVKQLNINFIEIATSFHPYRKYLLNWTLISHRNLQIFPYWTKFGQYKKCVIRGVSTVYFFTIFCWKRMHICVNIMSRNASHIWLT